MTPSDKMQMLRNYRDKSKKAAIPNVEIGESKVLSGINEHIAEEAPKAQVSPLLRNDALTNGKKLQLDTETYKYTTVVGETDEFDDVFKPLSFNMNYTTEEKPSRSLYEEIKQSIMSIDCTKGLEEAYSELDNLLAHMSEDTSSELTNSQILILVSTMIVKLEELNSYNYPELSLGSVKERLDSEGKKAVYSSQFNMYFFEEFFTYYQSIELEQFNKLKENYSSSIEKFSEFQQKKGEMLMTLLKWLIN